jgi:hypothetical protein
MPRMTYVGGLSEERSSNSSGGSSRSRKDCWWCVCVNGMAGKVDVCVDIFVCHLTLE